MTAKCGGCYSSFSGWWCDNCDQWPCVCEPECTCAMTESSFRDCAKHGEKAKEY